MEKILQYVWRHRLWNLSGLTTTDGRSVRVIDSGLQNTDSGPDFFNAKLYIGDELWAGNVEIHVRASDWMRHGHHTDNAYDSVILHVVEKDDCEVRRSDGRVIPQCVLTVPSQFYDRYNALMASDSMVSCAARLREVPSIAITDWIDSLAFERLQSKATRIRALLDTYAGSWEDVCYVTLSRSLGFGINNDAFERLARRTPIRQLNKHSDSLLQIEAMMFGQAGLLTEGKFAYNEYYSHLCREYDFLANKFHLTPMENSCWKFFRLRPQNFPFKRIALLSQLLYGGFRLMARLLECRNSLEDIRASLNVPLTGYWANHFTFDKDSSAESKALSQSSVDVLVINTVVPLYYAYGEAVGDKEIGDRAVAILEEMRPERNSIVEHFRSIGIDAKSAFTSQALIQLRREYCEPRKCLYCRIGHRLLSRSPERKG